MLLAPPPLTKRPVWKAATTVSPNPNESGSTCVRCWLEGFVYGSELTGVAITLAAGATAAASRAAAIATRTVFGHRPPTAHDRIPGRCQRKEHVVSRQVAKRLLAREQEGSRDRSEEHTSELQSLRHLVCRLLLEKKKQKQR